MTLAARPLKMKRPDPRGADRASFTNSDGRYARGFGAPFPAPGTRADGFMARARLS